jgi:hypothetical protein
MPKLTMKRSTLALAIPRPSVPEPPPALEEAVRVALLQGAGVTARSATLAGWSERLKPGQLGWYPTNFAMLVNPALVVSEVAEFVGPSPKASVYAQLLLPGAGLYLFDTALWTAHKPATFETVLLGKGDPQSTTVNQEGWHHVPSLGEVADGGIYEYHLRCLTTGLWHWGYLDVSRLS